MGGVVCGGGSVAGSANMSGARDIGQCWGQGTSGPPTGVSQQA